MTHGKYKKRKMASKFQYINSVHIRPPKDNWVNMYVCTGLNVKCNRCMPCFILLHFVLPKYYVFCFVFTNWRFFATLCPESLSELFLFKNICSLRVSVSHFGNSCNIHTFSSLLLCLLWCSAVSGFWCYYCDSFFEGSYDGYQLLAIKYFKIKVYTFLKHNAIAPLIDYSTV